MDHLNNLPVSEHGKIYLESDYMTDKRFNSFADLTVEDTKNIIKRLATKNCEFDPLPSHFLKDNIDIIAPTICHIN